MKHFIQYALAIVLLGAIGSCSREDGKDGINGINGLNGKDGSTILSGSGAPTANTGKTGDFYLDTKTLNLYGPKTENGWGGPFNLNVKDASKTGLLRSGNQSPTNDIGEIGDWYIDLQSHILYGPKTAEGWGNGIVLGNNTLQGEYILSKDGSILYQWFNKGITTLDMEADPELKRVTRIGNTAFKDGNLTQIILPKGLKSIGRSAFE